MIVVGHILNKNRNLPVFANVNVVSAKIGGIQYTLQPSINVTIEYGLSRVSVDVGQGPKWALGPLGP